ncbi:MAG: hypothetical protein Unbinned2026contig1000_3 [Prokaryotic dsDNA virus sp.]|nr:MAG: hypothetical protein Unbinned2026contig1000_3 [Prokaryotic dsDNA virus sp.]|tara:strand:+ start:896 stop:1387 length:492 start_codon:yes stop_codon:yes gene_type:complete
MFSLDEINRMTRMDYPHNKIIRWEPEHYDQIDFNEHHKEFLSHFHNYENYLQAFAEGGDSFTALVDGDVYAMFGCFPLWNGVAEAWMIPSKYIKRKTIALHRGAMLFFEHYAKKKHLKRLQFTVNSTNFHAVRWAKRCYFTEEGRLKNYGPDGKDHFMFARYY